MRRCNDVFPKMKQSPSQISYIAAAFFVIALFSIFFSAYFSPLLFAGKLLAPGDGYIFHYPAFKLPWKVWEPNILAGYPLFADPQFQLWYPLRWLVPDFNFFIISAYVTAASLTAGYLYWKTQSALAAAAAGLVYASGGFMMAHVGHVAIIHAAAWLPLIIWAIDGAGVQRKWIWFASGTLGIALCALGGHPQALVLGLVLGGLLALSHVLRVGRLSSSEAVRLSAFYAAMVLAGLALTAVQLLPFLQLSQLAQRSSSWSFSDFASYTLTLSEIGTILQPYLFGSQAPGGLWQLPPYFGTWGLVETAAYAGTGTIVLATCAVLSRRSGDGALFWLFAFVVAILLATSGDSGLGKVLVELPVFGKFRAQGRAAMLITFSAAVLCGMGVANLQSGRLSRRVAFISIFTTLLLASFAIGMTMTSSHWQSGLAAVGGSLWPDVIKMILPCIILLATMAVLLFFWSRLSPRLSGAMIMLLLTVDVAQFGWFGQWAEGPVVKQLDPQWESFSRQVRDGGGRLLSLVDIQNPQTPASPNLNLLYDLPMAGGYGPLMPRSFYAATGIDGSGVPSGTISTALLAQLGISHVAIAGVSKRLLQFGNCGPVVTEQKVQLSLAKPIEATGLRITSHMGCSVQRKDGDRVLEVELQGPDGPKLINVLAGRDTSEWAYDRPDVIQSIQHRRAAIHRSFDGDGFQGHSYSAFYDISKDGAARDIRGLTLVFPSEGVGSLAIESMEFINDSAGSVEPLNLDLLRLSRFGPFRMLPGGVQLARVATDGNPMAWVVDQSVPLTQPEAEVAVFSGKLPDGKPFDPRRVVIVDSEVEALSGQGSERVTGRVLDVHKKAGKWSFIVQVSHPALLVISQSFYPGWIAEVNSIKAPILRANAAFQAIRIPAGESKVELWFDPFLLKIGLAITLVTVLGLMVVPLFCKARR